MKALHTPSRIAVQALQRIWRTAGKVCSDYENCSHSVCQSSYAAWAIADKALKEMEERSR